MALADELLHLSEHDKWSRRLEFTRGLNSVRSTRYAPDFNCTTVEKYLNGGGVECTPDEKVSVSNNTYGIPYIYNVFFIHEIVFGWLQ